MEARRLAVAPLFAAVARHIGRRNGDAAWLDVGIGDGALLLAAAEWGFEPVGFDFRAEQIASLRARGIEAHEGAIESFDAAGRFGIVSFNDRLPRLVDPGEALASARQLLSEDGLLVLTMPNRDAPLFKQLDADGRNPAWGEIASIHMFGRVRLYALLREQGFQPLEYRASARLRAGMDVIARRVDDARGSSALRP
jgi:SAM-dependent methyltransferase